MSDEAVRFNEGKVRWGLVPKQALEPMVRVLEYGSAQYGDWNWILGKGLSYVETIESLQRHLNDLEIKKDIDDDSNLPTIGHILCNAMFLSYMQLTKTGIDDRVEHPPMLNET